MSESSVETQSSEQDADTDTTAQNTESSGGDTTTTGLSTQERTELDRLRAIHKEEKRWESRAKSNFADAEKFRELAKAIGGGDAKSDFDPKSAIDELRSELQQANLDRIRADVARVKNVDPRYVVGATQDEMAASADGYLADVEARVKAALQSGGSGTVTKSPATESTSTVRGGDRVEGPKQITSEAELKKLSPENQLKAYQEGRLDKLMGR